MKKSKSADLLSMNIGCLLLAAGVYFFKIPNGFATGGVTGIGTILAPFTPISAGMWIWILNIALLIVGFIFLGKKKPQQTFLPWLGLTILLSLFL